MSDAADKNVLDNEQITETLAELPGWAHTEGALTFTAKCESAEAAIGLFDKIAAAAENANHHPDVLWSYNEITVDLASHDVGGVTRRDTRLAKTISGLAEAAGAKVYDGQV